MRRTALVLTLLLAACAAPSSDDDSAVGSDSNLTEKKIVQYESYVTGEYATSQGDARASLATACDAAKQAAKDAAGTKWLDTSCGAEENRVSNGYFLLGAKATTKLVVEIEQGRST